MPNPDRTPPAKSEKTPGSSRPLLIASLLFLAIYFAFSSRDGLHAYFTQDDAGNLLNMHKYWERSLADMLLSALRVVTGAFRPLGGVFYFTLYRLAGFNPVPFRAVCLGLMLVNVLLGFGLLRRLSGSLEVALIGAVLIAHHPAVLELLYSSGSIYEILCFLFYFLAVWCYFAWRQAAHQAGRHAGRHPDQHPEMTTLSWPQWAALLALTGCALDAKEMAMTLPGALFLIELIYFPPQSWSWPGSIRFVTRQNRAALATAALVVPTIAIKLLTRNPLSEDPRYVDHSFRAAVEAMRSFQNFLLYGDIFNAQLSGPALLALWVAMAVAAIVLRSRPMKFGLLFLIGSLLPVSLIGPRGGYMLYIPLIGWALYTGCLFQFLGDRLVRLLRLRPPWALAVKLAGFAAAVVLIMHVHEVKLAPYSGQFQAEQKDMRRVVEHLLAIHPRLTRGSALLLADDPLPISFGLMLIARIAYGDPTLTVDRIKMLRQPPAGDELTRYDHVLAGQWDLHDVRSLADPRLPVEVRFHPTQVEPGGAYTLQIPELAGQTVDLALRTTTETRSDRAILQDCHLDSTGHAPLLAPTAFPHSTIQIRWIRPRGGAWISASGALHIRPPRQ